MLYRLSRGYLSQQLRGTIAYWKRAPLNARKNLRSTLGRSMQTGICVGSLPSMAILPTNIIACPWVTA